MKKNVSGQKIGAQMVSATDGSAFTSAVAVVVTGDAGTQGGGGACTHEGNGYHTYAPSQAETNYDLIAFTFTGTGAVPATVQIFTGYPQTGDSYAEVTHGTYGLSALNALLLTIAGYLDTEIAAIKAKTDQLTFTAANKIDATLQAAGDFAQGAADKVWSTATRALTDKAGFALSAAGVQAVWDALTSALTTVGSIGKLLVDNVNATISSRLASAGYTVPPTVGAIADAVWDEPYAGHGAAGSTGEKLIEIYNNASGAAEALGGFINGPFTLGPTGNDTTHLHVPGLIHPDDGANGLLIILNHGGNVYTRWIDDWTNSTQLATVATLPFTPEAGVDTYTICYAARDLDAATLAKLTAHAAGVLTAVVGSGSTATTVKLATVNGAAPSSVDNFYNGAALVLTSGALAGQRVSIDDYDGASTTATVSGFTAAPVNGVTGLIV